VELHALYKMCLESLEVSVDKVTYTVYFSHLKNSKETVFTDKVGSDVVSLVCLVRSKVDRFLFKIGDSWLSLMKEHTGNMPTVF